MAEIYEFVGTFSTGDDGAEHVEPLTLDNTLWANTVRARARACACVCASGPINASITRLRARVGCACLRVPPISEGCDAARRLGRRTRCAG